MPAPTTCDELLELIRRSGVVDEARLRAHVQKLTETGNLPTEPQKLAGVLVRDGLLTYFQAEQLLQGKYKRFSLGKYKVLEKLGAGGMAQVFLCEHKLMRRRVAIKVLPVPKAEDPSSLQRFYREARAVAALDHPNIVRAYDIDQDENLHFLVMEYVDGTNLQELVKKFGPLDVTRACHYVYASAVGLQYAHETGLVHRDIKPGNILVDRAGVVKILDMGLARFFHDEEDNLTRMNDENVLGTADYLAPEQAIDSHTVDIRADIYSLGATFYYLLTGSAPFPEGSVAQKLIWHQNRAPRPVRSLRPEAPEALVAIIDRMMAKDPAKRYQTPAEVMAALASWVTTPIPPPPEREMPQLSTAAGGPGRSGGSGRPNGGLESNAPTVVARDGATPTPGAGAAHTMPAGVNPTQAVWESLDTDTQPVQGDTGRSAGDTQAGSRTHRPLPPIASRRTVLYVVLGVLLLAGAVAGIYFAYFNKPPKVVVPTPPPGPRTIIVSKAGGEFGTLRDALSQANVGDTIVIADPKLSETKLTLDAKRHRDVTIEGANPDKPPQIEASGNTPILFEATNVEGFRIRNVDLVGLGKMEVGVQLSGVCPGAKLENVTVRNAKGAGIRLQNAAGEPGKPILFDRVRVASAKNATDGDGVYLYASGQVDNRRVTIRNCRFEVPGRGIHIEGPTTDVDITENRFYGNSVAITFPRLAEKRPLRVQVNKNTICQAGTGFFFEFAPHEQKGKLEVWLSQNYFARTPALATVGLPGPPGSPPLPPRTTIGGVTSVDNAYDPTSAPGNFALAATLLESPLLPEPDPSDDATFLRFPGGPPEAGPNKMKVGAQ